MAARRGDPATLREVHQVAPRQPFNKALFYDAAHGALRPNAVFIGADGSVVFETNELGLKGDPRDRRRKLAVVWGDSVAFSTGRGWPCLLDRLAPGYQFLNGGIEGDPYRDILRRAAAFNRRHPVALNLLMLGWHPLVLDISLASRRGGNEMLYADLAAFLSAHPNTIVLTMPTALNDENIGHELTPFLRDGDDDTCFSFIGGIAATAEWQRIAFEHIRERNAITREVCDTLGVRLVDLFAALNTEDAVDFRENFVDIMHLRRRAHDRVATLIFDAIKDRLDP